MPDVANMYELQNAVHLYLTADSLFTELTTNNSMAESKYTQKIFSLAKDGGLSLSYNDIYQIFHNSHVDHVDKTNKELYSCCQDMEAYLKTLPDVISREIEKPQFDAPATLPDTIQKIESGINRSKDDINTRLQRVCQQKQELYCQDGIYTSIERARKQQTGKQINYKSFESRCTQLSENYLKQIQQNYGNLFQKFSNNIDTIMQKTVALKTPTMDAQNVRVSNYVEKRKKELTEGNERESIFQNSSYQGTRAFLNDPVLAPYYTNILSQIEVQQATNSKVKLEDRAFRVLAEFANRSSGNLSHEQIVTISHNVLKMLKVDSHLVHDMSDPENKTFIVTNPETDPVLFEPTRTAIKEKDGSQVEEPYAVPIDHDTIQKMVDGEQVTVGKEVVENPMEMGKKGKVLVRQESKKVSNIQTQA